VTLHPEGYGTAEVTIEQMVAKHGPKMHPEFHHRFFAWIESEGGRMGVGGGWRAVQPVKQGFAPPGQSFHESQKFASGVIAYAAVDLVHREPGKVHRAPTWAETASAKEYGLHTFVTGEPWHIQCIEMRGYGTWITDGRPDPWPLLIPGDQVIPPPTPPTTELPMRYIAQPPAELAGQPWLVVWDGAVRYATNRDTTQGLDFVVLNSEQYAYLKKCAGI
jgi:hypothetical protein